MGVEKMSGIYIPGAKIPDGDYVRVLMLHKDGTCVDGIGNVFKVIPVLPHGRLIDESEFFLRLDDGIKIISSLALPEDFVALYTQLVKEVKEEIGKCHTIIPASEEASA